MAEKKKKEPAETPKGYFASLEQALAKSMLTEQGGMVQAVKGAMAGEALARKKREEELIALQLAKKEAATAPALKGGPTVASSFTDGVFDPKKATWQQKMMHALLGGG